MNIDRREKLLGNIVTHIKVLVSKSEKEGTGL